MKPAQILGRATRLSIAALLAAWMQPVLALGMGEPLQHSYLAEPLRVEVPLSLGELESGEVAIRVLPTPRDSAQPVSDFEVDASGLKARLVKRAGEYSVVIESARAVREPVVEVSLEVTGGGVKVLRNLTLFMEPRPLRAPKPVAAVPNPVVVEQQAASPVVADQVPPAAVVAGAAPSSADWYGPVQSNETLSTIAAKIPGVSRRDVYRASAALMLLNPEALEGGDPNRLRVGSMLRIPGEGNIRNAPAGLVSNIMKSVPRRAAAVAADEPGIATTPASVAAAAVQPLPVFAQPKAFRLRFDSAFSSYQRLKSAETAPPVPVVAETGVLEPERAETVPVPDGAGDAVTPMAVLADEARPSALASVPVIPPNPLATAVSESAPGTVAPAEYNLMAWVLLFMSVVLAAVLLRQMRQPVVSVNLPPPPATEAEAAIVPVARVSKKAAAVPLKLVRSARKVTADERREVQGLMHRLAALRTAVLGEDSDLRRIIVIEAMVEEGKLEDAAVAIARLEEQTSSPQRRPG